MTTSAALPEPATHTHGMELGFWCNDVPIELSEPTPPLTNRTIRGTPIESPFTESEKARESQCRHQENEIDVHIWSFHFKVPRNLLRKCVYCWMHENFKILSRE